MGNLDFSSSGIIMTDTMYAEISRQDIIILSLEAIVITMMAGFHPGQLAARMEPVAALRGGKKN